MALRFTILGCGTSSGVPRIGNDWGQCDPTNPRNRRTRASILIESESTRLLVDTSPDMREQLLAADISHLDAVLWTHDHADHCHGIDDLRQIYHVRCSPVPGYARASTLRLLQSRFAYAFEGKNGYPAIVQPIILPDVLTIGDISIHCVDQPHGNIFSTGFRFEQAGKSIGYSTDFHACTDAMISLFKGVDIWIVDALREAPHPTHAHLATTLSAIEAVRPGKAYLTHMDQSMDYNRLRLSLPDGVEPAHDGLSAIVGEGDER
jgi:phosphoribosyl 1,2-cyclic phosphate phosphodiesterase